MKQVRKIIKNKVMISPNGTVALQFHELNRICLNTTNSIEIKTAPNEKNKWNNRQSLQ